MTDKPLASRLVGEKLGKWNVISKKEKDELDNSGAFSSCYFLYADV